jgi:hypothetical protein
MRQDTVHPRESVFKLVYLLDPTDGFNERTSLQQAQPCYTVGQETYVVAGSSRSMQRR